LTRILVISDIHSNFTALEAVLADAGAVDEVWCLGDLVGYGPDPNECISLIRELPNLFCMMGNHDQAAIGGLGLETFNGDAHRSLLWQKSELSNKNLNFLKNLPSEAQIIGDVTLVHGSPRDPIWEYIMSPETAKEILSFFDTQWCFFGHTHYPAFYKWLADDEEPDNETPEPMVSQPLAGRAILNPGSVGQPRDRDPRASYAIYDPQNKTWQLQRVEYDHKQVQERILKAELPPYHADRLSIGS
jgi:predicted phosphodiesterase